MAHLHRPESVVLREVRHGGGGQAVALELLERVRRVHLREADHQRAGHALLQVHHLRAGTRTAHMRGTRRVESYELLLVVCTMKV